MCKKSFETIQRFNRPADSAKVISKVEQLNPELDSVVREKSEESALNVPTGVILICKHMNWSLRLSDIGAWDSTKWTVYADQTMICESKYDGMLDVLSSPPVFKEGKTYTHKVTLTDEAFDKLKIWIKDTYPDVMFHHDGCDGDGWEITAFDENGDLIRSACGYIYHNTAFNVMLEVLGVKK